MRLTLQSRQVLCSRSSSHSISSLRPGSDFHQIFESSSLQTKRIRLLFEDFLNLLNSPLVDRSNVSTRSNLQPMTTHLSYLLNPFLLATALTNEISSSLYINQFGSISTSFWRYPLKSVRRKALGWISYFKSHVSFSCTLKHRFNIQRDCGSSELYSNSLQQSDFFHCNNSISWFKKMKNEIDHENCVQNSSRRIHETI